MFNFNVIERFNKLDCVHFIDTNFVYASYRNHIFKKPITEGRFELVASLPVKKLLDSVKLTTKLSRRIFRKRIENLIVLSSNTIVTVMGGKIYRIKPGIDPQLVYDIKRCRGTLHRGVAIDNQENLYLGEYYSNPKREPVLIFKGKDDGAVWSVCYFSPQRKFRHYHGCFYDKWENCLWFTTGDKVGENYIAQTDLGFRNVRFVGDGSKKFSAVNLLITEKNIYFANDNPFGQNYIWKLDKKNLLSQQICSIEGPAWYGYQTSNGIMFFASTVESGNSSHSFGYLYASTNGDEWNKIYRWKKDGLKPWPVFQFGVISFPAGKPMHSNSIWLAGQAFKGCDMSVWRGAFSDA